jgi:hypothetical protein
MKWRGFGRKRSWPNFKVLSRNSSGVTEVNLENLGQDSHSPGQDLNAGPPEYQEGVLTPRPRCSVSTVEGK